MQFGLVSWVSQIMSVLGGGGDQSMGWGNFEVNVGRPIVTNREFVAYLCKSARGDQAVV